MEDEAADQRVEQEIAARDSRRASQTHQAVAGASPQQTAGYAAVSELLVPGIPHCGASSTWQQKVLDVEAKLQNDLQQDLARLVFEIISDEKANSSSAWHQCWALALRSTSPQILTMTLRYLHLSITLVTMTSSISPPILGWLSDDGVSALWSNYAGSQLVTAFVYSSRGV